MRRSCGLLAVVFAIWCQDFVIQRVAAEEKHVCLGFFLNIDCPAQTLLTINSLQYGVSTCSGSCCPKSDDCRRNVQDMLASEYTGILNKCQGKATGCLYETTSNVPDFVTACGSGGDSYLRAEYSCNEPTTTQPPTTTTPVTTTTSPQPTQPPNRPTQPTTKAPDSTTPSGTGDGQQQGGLPQGAIIGIAVGAAVVVLFIVIVVVVCLLRRRRREKPQRAQFPPQHAGGASRPQGRPGQDDIYGFLPGAQADPDDKRAKRTSAFIKENQANGKVSVKDETKGGKKKSGGSRPKSSVKREDSQNRKVPNLLGPGERRPSRPKETPTEAPRYDNKRKSQNIQPGETSVPPAGDEDAKEEAKTATKSESPKPDKQEETKTEEAPALPVKTSKKSKPDAKPNTQSNKPENVSAKQSKATNGKTGAKSADKKSEIKKSTKENGEKDAKKGETVLGIHNPAFDTEDHSEENDEFEGTKSESVVNA